MIQANLVLWLLFGHFIGDFILQTHWQASNKSKNNRALVRHVAIYTGCLLAVSVMFFAPSPSMTAFVLVNGAAHCATDYVTSRISSKLFAKQDWHNFFAIVGLDQLIHHVTLILTMVWLLL